LTQDERNPALDTLRAIAILVVVITHLAPVQQPMDLAHRFLDLGVRGVDLFFVLSGYLIGGIAIREILRKGALNVPTFWKRRWLRTLPAYYAVFALYGLKQLLPHKSLGFVHPWSYVVFWQIYAVVPLEDFAHSWSLCVEEHFYLVLPLLLALFAKFRRRAVDFLWLVGGIGLVLMLIRTAMIFNGVMPYDRLSIWRTDGLVIGVMLAAWELMNPERAHALIAKWRGVLIAIATVFLVWGCWMQINNKPHLQPVIAIGCGAWVALAMGRGRVLTALGRWNWVGFTARISYSLYLLHPLVLSTLQALGFLRRGPAFIVAYGIIGVTLSFVAAWLSYVLVERTFLRLRERKVPAPPAASPAPEVHGGTAAQTASVT
jgi:peptidoglycan/LPS O-acetylase OafA/YrhL